MFDLLKLFEKIMPFLDRHGIGSGSGSAKSNIYIQDTQPAKYDGVWIQTAVKPKKESISFDGLISADPKYIRAVLAQLPYNFCGSSAVTIGTDVYLFGGNGGVGHSYKYDTLSGNYTRLTDITYDFASGSAVAIDNDVYLFGSSIIGNYRNVFKYNVTGSGEQKITKNLSFDFYDASVVVIGKKYLYVWW